MSNKEKTKAKTKDNQTTVTTNENDVVNEVTTEKQVTLEEELTDTLAKEKDKFLRLFAEFENYKKRTAKERIDLFKTANQDVITALLPILDDFERAYAEISKTKEKELLKGVELIGNKLKTILNQKGLAVVEITKGDVFNPDVHEAITQIPAPDKNLKGKVIDIVEKGYKLGDKIIRFPKVVIGQ